MNVPSFDEFSQVENDLFEEMFIERVSIMVVDGQVSEADAMAYAEGRIYNQILAMREE